MSDIPYSFQQMREIARSVKKGECPVKYAYFGEGAARFEAVLSDPNYKVAGLEADLLRKKAINIFHEMDSPEHINVVDLGCGDGSKAATLLKSLAQLGCKVRYCPIDISSQLINVAKKRVEGECPNIDILPGKEMDFEAEGFGNYLDDSVRSQRCAICLIALLGHTLGNVQQLRVLGNISQSMDLSDYCLVGVELFKPEIRSSLRAEYAMDSMYNLVFTPLEYMGVPKSIGDFGTRWVDEDHEVQVFLDVREEWDMHQEFERLPEETRKRMRGVDLKIPRRRITLARSSKFTGREVTKLLRNSGLLEITQLEDSEGRFLISLSSVAKE